MRADVTSADRARGLLLSRNRSGDQPICPLTGWEGGSGAVAVDGPAQTFQPLVDAFGGVRGEAQAQVIGEAAAGGESRARDVGDAFLQCGGQQVLGVERLVVEG